VSLGVPAIAEMALRRCSERIVGKQEVGPPGNAARCPRLVTRWRCRYIEFKLLHAMVTPVFRITSF